MKSEEDIIQELLENGIIAITKIQMHYKLEYPEAFRIYEETMQRKIRLFQNREREPELGNEKPHFTKDNSSWIYIKDFLPPRKTTVQLVGIPQAQKDMRDFKVFAGWYKGKINARDVFYQCKESEFADFATKPRLVIAWQYLAPWYKNDNE